MANLRGPANLSRGFAFVERMVAPADYRDGAMIDCAARAVIDGVEASARIGDRRLLGGGRAERNLEKQGQRGFQDFGFSDPWRSLIADPLPPQKRKRPPREVAQALEFDGLPTWSRTGTCGFERSAATERASLLLAPTRRRATGEAESELANSAVARFICSSATQSTLFVAEPSRAVRQLRELRLAEHSR